MDRTLKAALLAPELHRAALALERVSAKLFDVGAFPASAKVGDLAGEVVELASDLVEAAAQTLPSPPPRKSRRNLSHGAGGPEEGAG